VIRWGHPPIRLNWKELKKAQDIIIRAARAAQKRKAETEVIGDKG